MLEQREKVCKVCKAADNRGLPSRSAEHGWVESVLSPTTHESREETSNASKLQLGRGGSIFQENPLVWFKSFEVSHAKNLSSHYISTNIKMLK